MKTKLIASFLLGSSFLLANTIIGTWSLDKAKAKALQDSYSKDKQAQFLVSTTNILSSILPKRRKEKGISAKLNLFELQ